MKMTEHYLTSSWSDARELPGIGEYGARAWEIFCEGKLGTEAPKDHALTQYWVWATSALTNDSLVSEKAIDFGVTGHESQAGSLLDPRDHAHQFAV